MTTVFIISAPSGSGKSTLVSRLLAHVPGLMFSVSYTTRKPRGAEVDGQSYHFVAREEFEEMLARGEFLEWAQVFGNYYGTHCGILEKARACQMDLVLDIDVQGARQLKKKIPGAVTIFILPPSRAVLEQRLRARSEDREDVIARRLKEAAEEIRKYEAAGVRHMTLVFNWGFMADEQSDRSLRLFIDEVLPHFQNVPAVAGV